MVAAHRRSNSLPGFMIDERRRLEKRCKPAVELIKEIAILEREVFLLEQHLLSLYRAQGLKKGDSGIFRCHSARIQSPRESNSVSEQMVRCVSAMYIKLADPLSSFPSPVSSLSSAIFDRSDSSCSIEESNLEVCSLQSDGKTLGGLDHLRRFYSSLVSSLRLVDPRKMSHEESLAFWINIHNALIMDAHITHGIPRNNSERLSILFKAAYNVGGRTVTAGAIQTSILRIRPPRPRKLLNLLNVFRIGSDTRAYAIRTQEALLYFALACGSHSDPAVRVYTKKGVMQELETAKEEYIRGTAAVRDERVLVPQLVESYAIGLGLSQNGIVEMVQMALPECSRKSMKKSLVERRRRSVQWVPHNFNFRYLIARDANL